jgi:hypothetical protein
MKKWGKDGQGMVWGDSHDSNLFVPGASFLSIFVRKLYPILGYRGRALNCYLLIEAAFSFD